MCDRSSPCGNVLRVVLETDEFIIESCLNAHHFRIGTSAFDKAPTQRGRFAHLLSRAKVVEADLVLPPKDPACRYCRRSDLGACSRHGGLSKTVRDRVHYVRWSLRRNTNAARARRRALASA